MPDIAKTETEVVARAYGDLVSTMRRARAFIEKELDSRLCGAWESEHPYVGEPRALIEEIDDVLAKTEA